MDPLTIGLIGGGLLGIGGHASKQAQAERDRKVQAATTRYSPWTGMVAKAPEDSNLFGELLKGGLTGAMVGQGYESLAGGAAAGGGASSTAGLGVDTSMPQIAQYQGLYQSPTAGGGSWANLMGQKQLMNDFSPSKIHSWSHLSRRY